MFSAQISVNLADRECGGYCEVGELVVEGYGFYKFHTGSPVLNGFSQKGMKYSTAGIAGLEIVLKVQGFKKIPRIVNRQLC